MTREEIIARLRDVQGDLITLQHQILRASEQFRATAQPQQQPVPLPLWAERRPFYVIKGKRKPVRV